MRDRSLLANVGASVACLDIHPERAKGTASTIAGGGHPLGFAIASEEQTLAAAARAQCRAGPGRYWSTGCVPDRGNGTILRSS